MSKRNNPHFNAAQFASHVMESYDKALRGGANIKNIEIPEEKIVDFVMDINYYVDQQMEKHPDRINPKEFNTKDHDE